jgi:hypothetical protein
VDAVAIGRRPIVWRSLLLGTLLLILGSRLQLIQAAGSPVPFWDEWNGTVGSIVLPWASGQLRVADLLHPHNEHPIFFANLVSLVLTAADKQFDPRLGMITSAFLATFTAALLILFLLRRSPDLPKSLVLVGVAAFWIPPYNWHNILWAFQLTFYFELLFSLLALWGLLLHDWPKAPWWAGAFGAVGACLSLASGFLASLSVVVISLYLVAVNWQNRRRYLPSLLFAIVVVVTSLLLRVRPEGPNPLQTTGMAAFIKTYASCLAWPFVDTPTMALLWLPFMAFVVRTAWTRHIPARDELLTLAIGGWVLLYAVGIAYARGQGGGPPAVRYFDFLSLGPLCSLLSFVFLTRPWIATRSWVKRALPLTAAVWFSGLVVGLYLLVSSHTLTEIKAKQMQGRNQLANCREFLRTGNQGALEGKPYLMVPFPYTDSLAIYLSAPRFKAYAPTALMVPNLPEPVKGYSGPFVRDGLFPTTGKYQGEDVLGSMQPTNGGNKPVGSFVSEPFFIEQDFVEIPVAGYLGEQGLHLYLMESGAEAVSMAGISLPKDRLVSVSPPRLPKESWVSCYVRRPRNPVRLVAIDDRDDLWFAFAAPRGVGVLSYYAQHLLNKADLVTGTGATLLLVAIGVLYFSGLASPPEASNGHERVPTEGRPAGRARAEVRQRKRRRKAG